MHSPRPPFVAFALLASLTSLPGCRDQPLASAPSSVRFTLTAAAEAARATTGRAFEVADEAHVTVRGAETTLADTTVALSEAGDTEVDLDLEGTHETLEVEVELLAAGHTVFAGSATADVAGKVEVVVPVEVSPVLGALEPAVEVATGRAFTCALNVHGQVFCWGRNDSGQLGDGSTSARTVPGLAETETRFLVLSGGSDHMCGLTEEGSVWCWGGNAVGQLGNGTVDPSLTPEPLSGGTTFSSLASGDNHVCGVGEDARVYCWGRNSNSQLGFSSSGNCGFPCSTIPGLVDGISDVSGVDAGLGHTCAHSPTDAWCWGWNAFGQLGLGGDTASVVASPRSIALQEPLSAIGAANTFSCALDTAGRAWCWGEGIDYGQFGDGAFDGQPEPGLVSGGVTFRALAVTDANNVLALGACGISDDGSAWCWGSNARGQLGAPGGDVCTLGETSFDCRSVPAPVSGDTRFRTVDVGSHACGVSDDWRVLCWGANDAGQLGDGTTADRGEPTPVGG